MDFENTREVNKEDVKDTSQHSILFSFLSDCDSLDKLKMERFLFSILLKIYTEIFIYFYNKVLLFLSLRNRLNKELNALPDLSILLNRECTTAGSLV